MAPPDAPVPALPLQDRLLRRRDRRVHERLTGGVTGLDELLAADRLVDLTQPLGESTILWPGSHPFEAETTVDHDAHGAYARDLALPEHAGTHIDAPAHFHRGGATADLIPLATLVRPAVRLDVRELVGDDASFALSAEDIEDLEREDGLIRPDSAVLVDTGWDRYLDDPVRYSGGETTTLATLPLETGSAAIRVLLPAEARLTFEGVPTDRTGSNREFVTPALTVGRHYTYDVQATWDDNGRPVTRERQVVVRAGDRLDIDLTTAPEAESTLRAGPRPLPPLPDSGTRTPTPPSRREPER